MTTNMGCTVGTKTSSQTLQRQDSESVSGRAIGNRLAEGRVTNNSAKPVVVDNSGGIADGNGGGRKYTGYSLFMEENQKDAEKKKNNARLPVVTDVDTDAKQQAPLGNQSQARTKDEISSPTKRKTAQVDGRAVNDSQTSETTREIPESAKSSRSEF